MCVTFLMSEVLQGKWKVINTNSVSPLTLSNSQPHSFLKYPQEKLYVVTSAWLGNYPNDIAIQFIASINLRAINTLVTEKFLIFFLYPLLHRTKPDFSSFFFRYHTYLSHIHSYIHQGSWYLDILGMQRSTSLWLCVSRSFCGVLCSLW